MGLPGEPGVTAFSNISSTPAGNSSSCEPSSDTAHVVFMVVYGITFLVGLALNGITLKVYFCGANHMSSCITVYLKNLAAADFFISLCLPIRILNYASKSVAIRRVYCNFGASAFYLNMYASIMFMGYIAANRYLKIVHPLETHILQTVRGARIVSIATWVVLLITMGIYILISIVTQQPLDSVPVMVTCDALHSKHLTAYYKVIHTTTAIIFLCVLISLIYFYYSTSRRLSLAQQRQRTSSKKLARSRRNMLVLVSVFCVCFVPYHLVRVPYVFQMHRDCFHKVFFYVKEITVMVSVFNVCLDPLIYFIFCKTFRNQLGLTRFTSFTETQTDAMDRRTSLARMSSTRKNSLTLSTRQTGLL